MSARKRWLRYVVVLVVGVVSGALGDYCVTGCAKSPPSLYREPKTAFAGERDRWSALLDLGYPSVNEFAGGATPTSPSYFSAVERELADGRPKSAWFEARLFDELSKSSRPEDATFLLRVGVSDQRTWIREYARRGAVLVALRGGEAVARRVQ